MNLRFLKQLLVLPIIVSLFAFSFIGKSAKEIEGLWFSKDVENSVIKVVKETNKDVWNAKIIKSDKPEYVGKTLFRNCIYNSNEKTVISQGKI